MSLTQVTSDVISTNTISGLISLGFTSLNVANIQVQTVDSGTGNNLVFRANTAERMRINSSGFIGINNTAPTRLVTVQSPATSVTPAGNPSVLIYGDNNTERIVIESITQPVFTGRGYGGTFASKSAVFQNQWLLDVQGSGYYDSANTHIGGRMGVFAAEAWTSTARGGYITFATTSIGSTTLTEKVRIDANGNVGIATTAPVNFGKFAVQGASTNRAFYVDSLAQPVARYDDNSFVINGLTIRNTALTGSNQGIGLLFQLGASGTPVTSGVIQMRSEGDFSVSANQNAAMAFGTILSGTTTERMRITSAGDVGIGTSSPSSLLTISSSTANPAMRIIDTSGAGTRGGNISGSWGGNGLYLDSLGASGWVYIGLSPGGGQATTIRFDTSNTERMRIDSSGNLGIGTSSPSSFSSASARVVSVVTSAGNNTIPLALVNNDSNNNTAVSLDFVPNVNIALAQIQALRTNTGFGGATDFRFLNYNGSSLAERVRINSSGAFIVNATAVGGGNVNSFDFSPSDQFGTFSHAFGTADQTRFIKFQTNASEMGSIKQAGSGVSYNTTSDYRLKENVEPLKNCLNRVMQLKPVSYKWKHYNLMSEGFIAHELAEVVPKSVTGEKDAVDADGNPIYQGIDTSYLVATLTAAIQEQQAMIQELKTEVALLKAK